MIKYSKKIFVLILFVLPLFFITNAQMPKGTFSDGVGSSKKIYSPPKKPQIKSFAAKDFSFTIDFAGTPEKKADEINVVGLKIPMISFKIQRETDYSFVEVYDFPYHLMLRKNFIIKRQTNFSILSRYWKNKDQITQRFLILDEQIFGLFE
jgi:hypothetical protein